jgi:2-C-methyl-D-erythritol 4-phosphate cytidylyltransferase/2-C-methyl-D-erythritol 4-phosphate cytidylyltransferase/2-C-methyl-D-erythritol 2,4-cyclodiphosphate synthase
MMPRCHAVIVTAAGSSTRFNASSGSSVKKEFLSIGSEPILAKAIRPFLDVPGLAVVAVTYRDGDLDEVRSIVEPLRGGKDALEVMYVKGGATRQESVFNALKALYDSKKCSDIKLVSIHDGARPFVSTELVRSCLDAAEAHGGACPCIRVTDTLVKVGEDGLLCSRIDRSGVCTVQTPQTFRFPDIWHAHQVARPDGGYTDDTGIFMDWGGRVAFVQGSAENRKITYEADLGGGGAGK